MSWIERKIFGETLKMKSSEIMDSLKSGGVALYEQEFKGKAGKEDKLVEKVVAALAPIPPGDKEAIIQKMNDGAREWVGDDVNRVVEKIIAKL